ncbi:hypothetical protein Nepgr_014386 [Nepenthes gracilis]|uniref:Uncharacterized protein n=1 Tax=Nepenthes gracilis TaxID=150966 RepID=A0AAD3SJ19_NEPGR|nr:hypothetical protein Nepgr_014386 [Nepenthes gracilis]
MDMKSSRTKKQRLPPKRGTIKIKIIGQFIKSAVTVSAKASGIGRRIVKNGSSSGSTPITHPATPTGYTSDDSDSLSN